MKRLLSILVAVALGALWLAWPRAWAQYPHSPHFDNATGRFHNPQPLRGVTFADGLSGLGLMLLGDSRYGPKAPLPMQVPDWDAFLAPGARSRFIWFGHSTLLARIAGHTVAIDPVLGPSVSPLRFQMRRFQPPAAPLAEWPVPDIVLLSHNHYDHLEEAGIRKLAQTPARFIVPLGLSEHLARLGVRGEAITELDWWQSTDSGALRITLVPALHYSGRGLRDGGRSFWGGFVLQQAGETFYYSGDSAWGGHFAEIAARFPDIAIAFIENGQYDRRWPDNHLFPEQTAQAAAIINARRTVPVHWGAYSMAHHPWDEPVRRSVPKLRELGLAPLTPLQGQVFDAQTQTGDWFAPAP